MKKQAVARNIDEIDAIYETSRSCLITALPMECSEIQVLNKRYFDMQHSLTDNSRLAWNADVMTFHWRKFLNMLYSWPLSFRRAFSFYNDTFISRRGTTRPVVLEKRRLSNSMRLFSGGYPQSRDCADIFFTQFRQVIDSEKSPVLDRVKFILKNHKAKTAGGKIFFVVSDTNLQKRIKRLKIDGLRPITIQRVMNTSPNQWEGHPMVCVWQQDIPHAFFTAPRSGFLHILFYPFFQREVMRLLNSPDTFHHRFAQHVLELPNEGLPKGEFPKASFITIPDPSTTAPPDTAFPTTEPATEMQITLEELGATIFRESFLSVDTPESTMMTSQGRTSREAMVPAKVFHLTANRCIYLRLRGVDTKVLLLSPGRKIPLRKVPPHSLKQGDYILLQTRRDHAYIKFITQKLRDSKKIWDEFEEKKKKLIEAAQQKLGTQAIERELVGMLSERMIQDNVTNQSITIFYNLYEWMYKDRCASNRNLKPLIEYLGLGDEFYSEMSQLQRRVIGLRHRAGHLILDKLRRSIRDIANGHQSLAEMTNPPFEDLIVKGMQEFTLPAQPGETCRYQYTAFEIHGISQEVNVPISKVGHVFQRSIMD